jgi:uncharacterized protein DUF6551
MITMDASPRAPKHTVMRIEPVLLTVDPLVQRPLDSQRVAAIAANFRPEAFGVIHISQRKNGSLHIIDGQHRIAAAKVIGRGDLPVDAVIWEGLTTAEEAAMFRWLNNTRQVQVLDRFRIRTVEGDPVATALNNLLEAHGWTVRKAKATGSFFAVSALENAYNMTEGGDITTCNAVVEIATAAWGHDSNGLRAEIVSGMGSLLRRHPKLDKAKLVTELAKLEGGPLGLIGKAKQLRDIRGGRVSDAMAEILTNMHNKQRKLNRLPEWRAG